MKVDPDYLLRTAESPGIRGLKARAHERLGLHEGDHVVDVGCGPAIDTLALARRVGPAGRVSGFDADPEMVARANRLANEEGLGTFTRHEVADATALPLPSGAAAACYSERLLQHLPWPASEAAVQEFARVVRPGGRVVVVDTDWGTLSIAAPDPALERRVVQQHWLAFANPFAGRYLTTLMTRAGLQDVAAESVSMQLPAESLAFLLGPTLHAAVGAGRLHALEAQRWWAGLRAVRVQGPWFAHLGMVLASGTAP